MAKRPEAEVGFDESLTICVASANLGRASVIVTIREYYGSSLKHVGFHLK